MSGTSNFQQWNPNATNQETDSQYTSDAMRTGGAADPSIFPSATANKLFYQVSTFAAAFAQALANKGYSLSDANLSNLAAVLANVMTQADMTPYAPLAGPTFTGTPSTNALTTTGIDAGAVAQIRMEYSGIGVLFRQDGSTFYILMTPSGNPAGSFTAARPLMINLATGAVTIDQTGAGTTFGAPPTFPTRAPSDNTTYAANTAFVAAAVNALAVFAANNYAPVNSPIFTGSAVNLTGGAITIGPPGGASDNSTRVPNTNWVQSVLASALAAYTPLGDFNPQSLSSNGYIHLPGGLLAQWGSNAISGAGQAINFQIPFPNSVFFVQSTDQGSGGTTSLHTTSCPVLSLSQFKAFANDHTGAPASTNLTWFALGV
jgi:hypothetical protein